MKWIRTKDRLPETTIEVHESACTYDPSEVSDQILLFCEGDDQYHTGWFCKQDGEGDFFEIYGIGDANVEDVSHWMPITVLTESNIIN